MYTKETLTQKEKATGIILPLYIFLRVVTPRNCSLADFAVKD